MCKKSVKIKYMQKIIKSRGVKTIVVRLTTDNVQEFDVDCNIFDDPYIEAATRAIETTKKYTHGIVRAIAECWEKKDPKKTVMVNSYWILVNASCYRKAELLREKFKFQTECDLAKEPLHGRIVNTR